MTGITITAHTRQATGTAHARRSRQLEHKIPGIVYGAGLDTQMLEMDQKTLSKALSIEGVHAKVLQLKIDDQAPVDVLLKRCQRHASRSIYLHIDFLRVKAREKINVKVPLHFAGEDQCQAITDGGVAQHLVKEVEVHCTPAKLPTHIDVDISELAMDQALHLSDISLERGVEFSALIAEPPRDDAVVTIHRPKVVAEEESTTDESTGTESATEDTDTASNGDSSESE